MFKERFIPKLSKMQWAGVANIAMANTADVITTINFLRVGHEEFSPFWSKVIEHGGEPGLIATSVLTTAAIEAAFIYSNRGSARLFITVFTATTWATAAVNHMVRDW